MCLGRITSRIHNEVVYGIPIWIRVHVNAKIITKKLQDALFLNNGNTFIVIA